ncbi:hypothetical protein THAOC_35996, partial [Thalassiosira oceanica]
MADRPREKRVESREWSGAPYARLSPTSPLGVGRLAHLQSDYSTLSGSVGSAGTTTIGRGYSDGSTAAIIYQTSRCNGKFVHHRTSPACRGLGAAPGPPPSALAAVLHSRGRHGSSADEDGGVMEGRAANEYDMPCSDASYLRRIHGSWGMIME